MDPGVFSAIGIPHRTRSLVRIAENWLLALPLVHDALRTRCRFLVGHVLWPVWSVVGLKERFEGSLENAWLTFC